VNLRGGGGAAASALRNGIWQLIRLAAKASARTPVEGDFFAVMLVFIFMVIISEVWVQ